jgi:hypothetical protein
LFSYSFAIIPLYFVNYFTSKGKIIRSRVQWIEEGGKPTKYFCGLESKIFTSKIIPKIERDDGKTITKQFDILVFPPLQSTAL